MSGWLLTTSGDVPAAAQDILGAHTNQWESAAASPGLGFCRQPIRTTLLTKKGGSISFALWADVVVVSVGDGRATGAVECECSHAEPGWGVAP